MLLRKTKGFFCDLLPLFNGIQQSIILRIANDNLLAQKWANQVIGQCLDFRASFRMVNSIESELFSSSRISCECSGIWPMGFIS